MSDFNDPATGGDKLPLPELDGSLLLFNVHEALSDMQTSFGVANPVRADVTALDGPLKGTVWVDALVFPRVLGSQLRPSVGQKVLGRLGKGVAKVGQSAPWTLATATDDDKAVGRKYLAYAEAQAVAAEEPF